MGQLVLLFGNTSLLKDKALRANPGLFYVLALSDCSKEGVISKGIENEKELEVVKTMKIHLVQGYLFGKPKIVDNPDDF